MMNASILEKVGFTKGEVKIYLAMLDLGETTTGPIINKSQISSSKVYEILEKLIQKGLVSYTTKNRTKYYQATSPRKIREYLELKEKAFKETKNKIEKILPELEAKQNASEDTQTTSVYEGFEGIKTVFNRILNTLEKGEEYYVFTLDEEVTSKELQVFFPNYHLKRIKQGIKAKLLSNKRFEKEIKKRYPTYKLSERRFIDHAFPNGVFILKNLVIHFIYTPKPTLFIIQSRQNYLSYKEFFLELWDEATP